MIERRLGERKLFVMKRPDRGGYGIYIEIDGGYVDPNHAVSTLPVWRAELNRLLDLDEPTDEKKPLQVAVFSTTSDDPMENYSYLVDEPE